ncbi:HU family DNA-binding protein [Saccharopolyspora sp. NPDC000359]|uniref:HU family DNA-binding protein n=1 Tax=Saccharopolyspora sp. NPDC000359 TaxID=3154251 RepID=UPI00332F2725
MALTKDQLVTEIAEAVDVSKTSARAALDALTEIVADQLTSGGEVTLPGFGKFKVADRPARTGRNPATGESIEIAAKRVVKFVPAKALEDSLNKTS